MGDSSSALHSPVRLQYLGVKEQHPDAIVFFRMGDFYETFDEDATLVAGELDITLTRRDWGKGELSPMAGVPHHAAEGYIARLIANGHRVAVCDQVSDPSQSRGLVEREVTRVITPGTVVDPAMLVAKRNNFLAAAVMQRETVGVAFADVTTGEFACTQFTATQPEQALLQELARIHPAELLLEAVETPRLRFGPGNTPVAATDPAEVTDTLAQRLAALNGSLETVITSWHARDFREDIARTLLLEHFGVTTLEPFGCDRLPLAIRSAGAVLAYLRETQRAALNQFTALETYSTSGFMSIDAHTRRNLELFESGRGGSVKGSLLWVLDSTRTPMGGRLLRRWIAEPLLDRTRLTQRQDAISAVIGEYVLRTRLAAALAHTGDLERLTNRIVQRIASPRDLVALAQGLRSVRTVAEILVEVPSGIREIASDVQPLDEVASLIEGAIVEAPPVQMSDGGIIRPGYSDELDAIATGSRDARAWVAGLEKSERERTGISNLKVGFNRVFGYYIEVSNSQVGRVPEAYIRKQTLTTGERYITPELKHYESLILNAQEKSAKLEQELFSSLRAEIGRTWAERLLHTARALAELDVVTALADVAARQNYCRPELVDGDVIHIVAGRHPVVEVSQRDIPFVPNDTQLSTTDDQILILTGPNMAGKSTYLRQVALITLMAHVGSFVPAESARIGIVDRIFTRIGAQDDLATGQSTFMVEMVETAAILHHATPQSLVILDEIGRGTSTYDGLAIARAVVEYLHNNRRCGARTLFATHYHELVDLAGALPKVKAYNVAVTEEHGEVVFLRKIVPGGADKSYGIHVAQLAGIPRQVVRRAEEVLEELESTGSVNNRKRAMRAVPIAQSVQLTLFSAEPDPLIEELKQIPVDELTPLEAISRLYDLQRRARDR